MDYVAGQVVKETEVLSQYGFFTGDPAVPMFRSAPRPAIETELSLFVGPCMVDEITLKVRRRAALPSDAVRHVLAGDLLDNGFLVIHTPTRASPTHVSVYTESREVPWTSTEAHLFEAAFENWKGGRARGNRQR